MNESTESDPPDSEDSVEDSGKKATESASEEAPVVIEAEAVDVTETEDEAETEESEEASATEETPPLVAMQPTERRASFMPMLFGGLAAGGIGYLAATYLDQAAPVDTAAISASIAETDSQVDALTAAIDELKAAPTDTPDLSGIEDQIASISAQLEDMGTDIAMVRDDLSNAVASVDEKTRTLSERLTVLETSGATGQGAEATEEELAAFRAELERMTTEAEAQIAEAQAKADATEQAAAEKAAAAEQAAKEAERQAAEAAAIAKREAAVVELKAALESGESYSEIIAVLGDLPDALTAYAEEGVTPLVSLQQQFPNAARNALAVAETAPQDASTGEKLTAFLMRQTNARSLTPKEGGSTDAILSRAEAMLKQGDLNAALAELADLPEAPRAAMAGWIDPAEARAAAINAVSQLSVTN